MHLILTLFFIAAAAFYFYSALLCHRRGDSVKWLRVTSGAGFVLIVIGLLSAPGISSGFVFFGAIVVFVSAVGSALLVARRRTTS